MTIITDSNVRIDITAEQCLMISCALEKSRQYDIENYDNIDEKAHDYLYDIETVFYNEWHRKEFNRIKGEK